MISVIVPIHNTSLYIKECLDSILNQTYSDLEVICIDSSTDETTDILKKIETEDSRIRVIADSNSSYGYKVNVGFRQAKGEYVGIVDSDDYIELNMYERLLNTLLENDADFVKSDHSSFYVEKGENVVFEYNANASDFELYGKCFNCRQNVSNLYNTGISIWTGLYKSEFLWKNNIFLNESDGASFQDAGFSVLTHVYGRRIYYLHESFYRYRTDNANSSVKSQKKYRAIADEWDFIDTQILNRGLADDDLIIALRARKIKNYEWNLERLDEETSKKFAISVNGELETQYIDTDLVRKIPSKYQNMFDKIYLKGLTRIPKKTQQIIDLINDYRVALVGMGELGKKIASYDISNNYFGIQKFYDESEMIEKVDGFYINVDEISAKMLMEDYIFLVADEGQGKEFIGCLENIGIAPDQMIRCSSFYIPEKLSKEEKIIQKLDEKEIKVSIIVPIFNGEQNLEECLESLIKQTVSKYEIICVNDGSTDGSLAILQRMQKLDSRIRIVTQKTQGLSVARNTGIQQAQGKYIMFCDSEDMLKANSVEKLYTLAEENHSEIVCYDAKCIYMTEELAKEHNRDSYYQRGFSYGINSGRDLFTRMMENNNFCDSECLMFINKKWMEESGLSFYAGILYEGCLFSVQCMMKAQRVYHINEQFYIYRVRKESMVTSHVCAANLYGRLVNLHFFNKLLFEEKLTERQEWALVEFTRIVGYHAKRLAAELDDFEMEKLLQMPLTHFMKLELEQYGVNSDIIRKSTQKQRLERILENAEGIEIYGAGVRGHRLLVYLYLNGYGEKVRNFVVSTKCEQPSQIGGIDVLAVDEGWKPFEENLLVIAFAGKEAKEMYKAYKNKGATNLLHLDGDIYDLVIMDLRKKLLL